MMMVIKTLEDSIVKRNEITIYRMINAKEYKSFFISTWKK